MPRKKNKAADKHPASPWTYLRSLVQGVAHRRLFDDLTAYCMFIGYPRSGHSIIGSLLDAHPDVVIANELGAVELFRRHYGRNQIASLILANSRRYGKAGRANSGYKYQVPDQWQGRERKIQVIGDKQGGNTSRILTDVKNRYLLQLIPRRMEAPLRLIHVIRNPFDILSTMVRRVEKRTGRPADAKIFDREYAAFAAKVVTNQELARQENLLIHHLYQEDFIARPADHLNELCQFIGVAATPDYLQDCSSIVWNRPNRSRFDSAIWDPARIQRVDRLIQSVPFLRRYTFAAD